MIVELMVGALIIDKPAGITSHDVVARVRRAAGIRRVGHAGTLDPFATGVLVVCIGRAARLVRYLVGLDKEYIATVRLGFATDTQDATGKQITPLRTSNELSLEGIRTVLGQFIGPQLQIPPMFSAKKIGGEKLYRAARAGREVEREPVNIIVYSIDLIEDGGAAMNVNEDGTCDFRARVRCSSGTYVRTLANDIGDRLGVGAHLAGLRRTAVGQFGLACALTLDEVDTMDHDDLSKSLISPSDLLSHLPLIRLGEDDIRRVANGRAVGVPDHETAVGRSSELPLRLCDSAGELVAVGHYDPTLGLARPDVVLGVEVV